MILLFLSMNMFHDKLEAHFQRLTNHLACVAFENPGLDKIKQNYFFNPKYLIHRWQEVSFGKCDTDYKNLRQFLFSWLASSGSSLIWFAVIKNRLDFYFLQSLPYMLLYVDMNLVVKYPISSSIVNFLRLKPDFTVVYKESCQIIEIRLEQKSHRFCVPWILAALLFPNRKWGPKSTGHNLVSMTKERACNGKWSKSQQEIGESTFLI